MLCKDLHNIDDFAINQITPEAAVDLFKVIDDRYKVVSTIIATQLKTKLESFHLFMGNDTKAEAAADRICHPAITIELKGPSRRK